MNFQNEELMDVETFDVCKKAAKVCSSVFWTFEHGAVRYMDYLYPECLGFFDSSYEYDPSGDSGKWIDELGFAAQKRFVITRPSILDETEKVVDDLYKELNLRKSVSVDSESETEYDSSLDDGDIPFAVPELSDVKKERSIRDYDYNIAFFSFEEEFLGIQNIDDSRIFIRGDDKYMYRIYYDDNLRVIKKETWKMAGTLAGSELITSHVYDYEDSDMPVSCILSGKNYRNEMKYNNKGFVIESKNYVVTEKGDYISGLSKWKFDDDGKVLEKETLEYTYKAGSIKKIISTESRKEKYQYIVDDKTPDYYYYENDMLRLKKTYSSKEDYITSTYFDGGFVVESYYTDYTRTKDIFYLNGKVKRVKNYAK